MTESYHPSGSSESGVQPVPLQFERLTSAPTLGEALDEYNSLARRATLAHGSQFPDIVHRHEDAFGCQLQITPSPEDIDDALSATVTDVDAAMTRTQNEVATLFATASQVIPNLLEAGDVRVLNDALSRVGNGERIGSWGRYSPALRGASNPQALQGIKASLDALVLAEARHETYEHGAASPFIEKTIKAASLPHVAKAIKMVTGIDAYYALLEKAADRGVDEAVDSISVGPDLNRLSDDVRVRSGLKASLDQLVWAQARLAADRTGNVNSPKVGRLLKVASSIQVYGVFARQLGAAPDYVGYRPPRPSRPSALPTWTTEEQFVRGLTVYNRQRYRRP